MLPVSTSSIDYSTVQTRCADVESRQADRVTEYDRIGKQDQTLESGWEDYVDEASPSQSVPQDICKRKCYRDDDRGLTNEYSSRGGHKTNEDIASGISAQRAQKEQHRQR